jgi:hypothetical protein
MTLAHVLHHPWHLYHIMDTTTGFTSVNPHPNSSRNSSDTSAKAIHKGTCLAEWTPYLITPLYRYLNERDDGVFQDPTCISGLSSLPRWNDCSIWRQPQPQQQSKSILWKSTKLQRFLKHASQTLLPMTTTTTITTRTISSDSLSIWKLLCLLTTLQVIDTSIMQQQRGNSDNDDTIAPTIQSPIHDHNHECMDDLDDDDLALLMELWPLILQHIDWKTICSLYRWVRQNLHMVTIPHPLTQYAQTTLFQLDEEENEIHCQILRSVQQNISSKDHSTTPPPPRPSPTQHRYRSSQQWLDIVANLPDRVVGVLLKEPFSDNIVDGEVLPLRQSCLPTTCLELKENSQHEIRCRWIALYDLPHHANQQPSSHWTVSTQPMSSDCDCFRCRYKSVGNGLIEVENILQAVRLAHSYFQRGELNQALLLYRQCHDTLSNNLIIKQQHNAMLLSQDESVATPTISTTTATANATTVAATIVSTTITDQADMWHSIGAVLLTQLKFIQAQYHWRNGSHYQDYHLEIKEQLNKQQCYGYFDPLPSSTSFLPLPHSQEHISLYSQTPLTSTASVFVASNVIDETTCRHLIQSAMDFATAHGGWTTNRHYAVPTQDLPVHHVPNLLRWFQKWMIRVLFPLLHYQFHVNNIDIDNTDDDLTKEGHSRHLQRFYVHDAFLVRYEATSTNNFLPLHYDESTHSCVVALNDDFEGGGTYIYDEDKTVMPSVGGIVSFRGNQTLHGGSPVTSGVRYILAIFLYLDDDTSTATCDMLYSVASSLKRKRLQQDDRENKKGYPNRDGFTFSFF